MTVRKRLWIIFGRIVGFSVLTTLGLTAVLQAAFVSGNLHNCYMPGLTETVLSGAALLIALCSATLFFARLQAVRASPLRSAAAFTLLPLVASFYVGVFLTEDGISLVVVLHLLALFSPVWFWILRGYFQFRKKEALPETGNDS